jgi:hypothetical protein
VLLLDHGAPDIGKRTPESTTARSLVQAFRRGERDPMFSELQDPEELCIVLLSRSGWTHCGVWVRDKVAHLTRDGVRHEPLSRARQGFGSVRFFKCA